MVGVIFLVRRLFNERGDGGGGRGVATWAGRGGAGPVMTVVAVSSEWPSAVTTGVPSHPVVWDMNIKVNIVPQKVTLSSGMNENTTKRIYNQILNVFYLYQYISLIFIREFYNNNTFFSS